MSPASPIQLSHRNVCRTFLGLQTKVEKVFDDFRVAPRLSFQTITLTAMVMSLSGEHLWCLLDGMDYTLLSFKCGGGREEDRGQLGAMTWLVITIFNQLVQLHKVKAKS